MNQAKTAFLSLTALTIISSLCGCGHLFSSHKEQRGAHHDTMFAVTAKKASFYQLGPMQGRGPDRELTQDTLVTVVHFSLGYSKVKLLSGETGFVANDDIARAPLRLIAQADPVSEEISALPPTPHVELPTRDTPSPEFEPTPIPASLMPQ